MHYFAEKYYFIFPFPSPSPCPFISIFLSTFAETSFYFSSSYYQRNDNKYQQLHLETQNSSLFCFLLLLEYFNKSYASNNENIETAHKTNF